MDYSLPGSSVHGILQARVLEWGAIAFSVRQPDGYIKKKRTRYNKINSDGLEMLDVKNKLRENNFQVWLKTQEPQKKSWLYLTLHK